MEHGRHFMFFCHVAEVYMQQNRACLQVDLDLKQQSFPGNQSRWGLILPIHLENTELSVLIAVVMKYTSGYPTEECAEPEKPNSSFAYEGVLVIVLGKQFMNTYSEIKSISK